MTAAAARKILLTLVLLPVLGCSLQNFDREDGVIWSVETDGAVTCGIEIQGNSAYFADEFASIYSLWIDSGLLRWKRTLAEEKILALHPAPDSLVVVSTTALDTTMIRHYSYREGGIMFQTNLVLKAEGLSPADGPDLLLHSADSIVRYRTAEGRAEVFRLGPFAGGLRAVVKSGSGWYAVSAKSVVAGLDPSFGLLRTWTEFEGLNFSGSAFYRNHILFFATDAGVKALSSSGAAYHTSMSWAVPSSPLLPVSGPYESAFFTASASPQRAGLGKYQVVLNDVAEEWFRPLASSVTLSPVAFSDTLSVVAAVDDTGVLNVFNAETGAYVNSRHVGIINRPGLKFGLDYFSKSVFVPASAPSRVVCYSLYYAVNKRMY